MGEDNREVKARLERRQDLKETIGNRTVSDIRLGVTRNSNDVLANKQEETTDSVSLF